MKPLYQFYILTLILLTLLLAVGGICMLPRTVSHKPITTNIQLAEEWAYFQGQKDALNGDIRLQYDSQIKKYYWKKSCWDGGLEPTFDPLKSEDLRYFLKTQGH